MKKKLLRLIIMSTKYSLYGFIFSCILLQSLLASSGNAQEIKSVKEVQVKLALEKVTLREAFAKIERITDFRFIFNDYEIDKDLKVSTYYHKGQVLSDVLLQISEQANLQFKQVNKNISVKRLPNREIQRVSEIEVIIQTRNISGKVTSYEDGEGLPGVNVVEKGTSNGTVTNVQGEFSLEVAENAILVFSSVGYTTEEVTVGNQSVIDLAMIQDIKQLQELVVVGYGQVRKSDLTGSVGTIKAEEIKKQPVTRVDQALQGRISGVQVTTINGAPGTGSSIRIRGGNSINAGNEPLYVIDGFIGGGDLNTINPNDIKSIEILKDASATAIYGSRGSNGVILITTKRGSEEGFGVSVDSYVGMQSPIKRLDLLNGPEFADYRNEYSEFLGTGIPFSDVNDVSNTDWQEVLFRDVPITDNNLSIYNNTENSNYYVSLNYLNQQGIQIGSSFKRYQMRINFDHKLGSGFKMGVSLNGSHTNRENPRAAAISTYVLPTAPIYNDDGSYFSVDQINGSTYNNPVAQNELIDDNTYGYRALGNTYLQFNPIEGLIIKSTFGFDFEQSKRNRYTSAFIPTNLEQERGGEANVDTDFIRSIQSENTINYQKNFGKHSFDILGGWTYQTYALEALEVDAVGFTNDVTRFNAIETSDPEQLLVESGERSWTLLSGLYRLNYSFDGKYLVTVSGRHDGSSRLAEGNKWDFFPSAALAWRVSDEPFMSDMDPISNLKLRTSYGRTGSQSIDPYATLARLNSGTNYIGGRQVVTVEPSVSASPFLRWEVTDQFDIGAEFGFFNDRLNIEFDYYVKETSDLLLARELSFQTGFGRRLENIGSLRNKGFDLSVNGYIIENDEFEWSSTLTFSSNNNEVLELSGGDEYIENGEGSRIIVGEPIGTFYGLRFIGLWQQGDENLGDHTPGEPKFEDINGDGMTDVADGQIIGSAQPDFYGGLNNEFSYKNFALSLFFDFSYGNDIYDLDGGNFNSGHNTSVYGYYRDRWTPENTNTTIPRAGTNHNTFRWQSYGASSNKGNSYFISDGSYLRLRNIHLQYDIPFAKAFFNNLTIYGAATNVFTISDYQGFSPDVSAEGTNATRRGFDSNGFPIAKTYTIGLRAGF